MMRRSKKPASLRDAWTLPPDDGARGRWLRRLRRAVAALLLVALAAVFVALVIAPFWHPMLHPRFASAGAYDAFQLPPIEFAREDAEGLGEKLAPGAPESRLRVVSTAADFADLEASLAVLPGGWRDVSIVYVAARGVVVDGRACLLAADFDALRPERGRYPLDSLLELLAKSSAGAKVLILDSGRLDYDVRLGLLVDEFPAALQTAVRQLPKDSRVWVLSPRSPLEASFVLPSLRRSAFGHFLAEAFRGSTADANGDHLLDLGEVYQSVRKRLVEHARQRTDGRLRQTPMLLQAGADEADLRAAPVLRSVGGLDLRTLKDATTGSTAGTKADAGPALERIESKTGAAKSKSEQGESSEKKSDAPTDGDSAPDSPEPPAADGDATATPPADRPNSASSGAATDGAPTGLALPAAAPLVLDVPGPDASLAALLAAAWRTTASFEARDPRYEPHPLAVAAPTWNAWKRRLEAFAESDRIGGDDLDRHALAGALRRELAELAGAPPDDPTTLPSPLAAGFDALRPAPEIPIARLPTWALVERAALWHASPPSDALVKFFDRCDRTLRRGDEKAWSELNKGDWPPDADRYLELRLVRRLAAIPGLTLEQRRAAWETTRLGERVAADPAATITWIRRLVDEADRDRLAGDRLLRDQLPADWRDAARRRWETARAKYDEAERALAEVHAARAVHAELLHRAPRYVRWFHATRGDEGIGPSFDDLARLLDQLATLGAALERLDEIDLPRLANARDQILLTRDRVERPLRPETLGAWLETARGPARAWIADAWRVSGLAPREFHEKLVRAAAEVDPAARTASRDDGTPGAAPPILTTDDWRPAARLLALERRLARLSATDEDDEALRKLDETIARHAPEIVAGGAPAPFRGTSDDAWNLLRDAGRALADIRRGIPSRAALVLQRRGDLRAEETRPEFLRRLREAERCTRLVDPRDLPALDGHDLAARLRRAAWYDQLDWQRLRALATMSDAPRDEADEAAALAAQCRGLASELPQEPPPGADVPPRPLLEGSSELPLVAQPQRELALRFRAPPGAAGPAWLVLAYDASLLEVKSKDVVAYDEFAPGNAGGEEPKTGASVATARPGEQGAAASWEIQAAAPRELRLLVRRKGFAGRSTRLIVKVQGRDFAIRHEIDVRMSALDAITLVPEGFVGSWSRQDSSLVLHPLPDQKTAYRFSFANQGETEKTVDVELLALRRPLASRALLSLPEREALDALGPTESLGRNASVKLPAGGQLVPFLPSGGGSAPEAGASETDDKSASRGVRLDGREGTNGGAEDAPAPVELPAAPTRPEPLAGVALHHGLLFVIRDPETKQTLFRDVEFRPLHPRAYLTANVGFDLGQQRIEIVVRPRNRDLIPPAGLKIRCEPSEPLPAGAESRLEGTIAGPQFEARMYVRLPADEARTVSLAISAGGYPRAFFFRVPCGVASANLPEADDVLAVRVVAPSDGKFYKTPLDTIPVKVEVDAPHGSFVDGRDVLEVGLDVDRDREFRGELASTFRSDRQTEVATAGFQGPSLTVETRVSDFDFDLPTGGLQNVRANVLARAAAGGRTAWSVPAEVVLDGAPPLIRRVHVSAKPPPMAGGEAEIVVSAVDGDLSGVARVEVALDPRLTGEFGGDASPMPAEAGEPTVWIAKLPLADAKPGQTQVIARAFDRAGNASRVARLPLVVLPKSDAADPTKPVLPGRLEGQATYAERPIPSAEIYLEEAAVDPKTRKRKQVRSTKADAQGRWTLVDIPPGAYVVRVRGLANNRMRLGSQEVQVVSPPAKNSAVVIQAK